MKLLLFFLAGVLAAQAPQGNARLRFSINSSQHLSRVWLGPTGSSWAMADENIGEIIPAYGSMASITLVGTSASTCGGVKCALDFNGSSDYVYISDDAASSPTNYLAVTTIAKIDAQSNHTLISKWGAGSNAFSMFFGEGSASNVAQCYLVQSDGSTTVVASGGTYTPNVWEAWTCVADGSTWRMYKNGILAGTPQSYDGTIQDSSQSMVIGSLGVGVIYFLDGKVAYADYRKLPMSDSQVRQNYKAIRNSLCNTFPQTGAGTFCTDLPR